jgi:uncharacterized membrane protein YdjX (TVP38/TMEM64 family)
VAPGAARLRLAALAALVGGLFGLVALTGTISPGRVRDAIDPLGAAAVPAFIVVSALLTCALFPGPLLAAASGLLFGTAVGTPVSIASATLGAVLAFTIARFVARDAGEALAGRRLRGVQAWIERRGFWAVLYARITPGVPYSLLNYVAGVTRVRLPAFAAATAIGVAPRAFAYTALGGSLDDLDSPEAIVAIVLLVGMAVGGAVASTRKPATAAGSETETSTQGSRSAGPR